VEHAISEWREGTQRRLDFKEDASVRYYHHLASLKHVQSKAPSYLATIQAELFKTML
jgi:hypothetical protein